MLLTSISYSLAAITLRQHDHTSSVALEQINVRVHTSGSSRAHRTASHSLRSLGRTSVINRMILDILRQIFTTIQTFFQFGVCNVTAYDNCTVQRQTGCYRIFIQFCQDFRHRTVQVNLHCIAFTSLTEFFRNQFARI